MALTLGCPSFADDHPSEAIAGRVPGAAVCHWAGALLGGVPGLTRDGGGLCPHAAL